MSATFPRRLCPLLCACMLVWAGAARADDATAEIQHLLGGAHWQQALQRLDGLIKQAPNDPRWAFDRGLALAGDGQTAAAIAAYTELTHRYPELPEPYNNLGVLLAQQGQAAAAAAALQQALLANPDDGLARENLADVDLQLALDNYTAASKLPGHGPGLQAKLDGLRALLPSMPQTAPALAASPIHP